jgi:hypothetical protein
MGLNRGNWGYALAADSKIKLAANFSVTGYFNRNSIMFFERVPLARLPIRRGQVTVCANGQWIVRDQAIPSRNDGIAPVDRRLPRS